MALYEMKAKELNEQKEFEAAIHDKKLEKKQAPMRAYTQEEINAMTWDEKVALTEKMKARHKRIFGV